MSSAVARIVADERYNWSRCIPLMVSPELMLGSGLEVIRASYRLCMEVVCLIMVVLLKHSTSRSYTNITSLFSHEPDI